MALSAFPNGAFESFETK